MRTQILSPMQWGSKHGRLPFDFRMPFMALPFSNIWAVAHWELENLALFNQAAYATVVNRNRELDQQAKKLASISPHPEMPDDEKEALQMAVWQQREDMLIADIEVEAISRYADEVTVIATWAFVEKCLNQGLAALQTALGLGRSKSHRWPEIEQGYAACGVSLGGLSSFDDADECRRVNNAIKHSGLVGSTLAARPAFTGKEGRRLDGIELDVQRYYFAAGDFTSAALERSSDIARAAP